MSDLTYKLRNYPNTLDCLDAALALEQAISLLREASDYPKDNYVWLQNVRYWLNTWDKDEEEE